MQKINYALLSLAFVLLNSTTAVHAQRAQSATNQAPTTNSEKNTKQSGFSVFMSDLYCAFFWRNSYSCLVSASEELVQLGESQQVDLAVSTTIDQSGVTVLNLAVIQGEHGATGATGPGGAVGPPGNVGTIGTVGLTGITGVAGPAGTVGIVGQTGETGVAGQTGAAGSAGTTGATGATGTTGP